MSAGACGRAAFAPPAQSGGGSFVAEQRDYSCSACGALFASRASTKRNARHKCEDGRTGTGQPVAAPLRPDVVEVLDRMVGVPLDPEAEQLADEPERLEWEAQQALPVRPVKPDEFGPIVGHADFEAEDLDEDGEPSTIPPGSDPERPTTPPHKRTRDTETAKVQNLMRACYGAMGAIDLTPEEEAQILGDLWSSFGEVHIDTGEIYIPGYVYLLACAAVTVSLTVRRGLKARGPVQTTIPRDPFGGQ
jgi:hypothetical protein